MKIGRSLAALACLAASPALSAELSGSKDLADLSLEDLANIEITSVSKHAERLSDAAASVYVITADDIRRSGATTLPEALRLAPNLEVARVNANSYAISARGFNNGIGNQLLVLIDGRTVYTPQFSGVLWNAQDVMLEDVERIEVISGPGGTLWGENAVNGVINVITRSSRDTQGALVAAGTGNLENAGAARYGGKLGDDGNYRVYARGFGIQNTQLAKGTSVADGWNRSQAGFRSDWGGTASNFTFQGDYYESKFDAGPLGPPNNSGANLLGRWNRQFDGGSSLRVQAYYDHTESNDPFTLRDTIDTYDAEAQHSFTLLKEHRILWGGGYRYAIDDTLTHFNALNIGPQEFLPLHRNLHWGNVFVQDEWSLGRQVTLTLGEKVETNAYTGKEYLPSARLAWKPSSEHLIWTAASRTVRAPSRIDTDFHLFLDLSTALHQRPGTTLFPIIAGGPDFQSEIADVYEIGYRGQPVSRVSYSITAYHEAHYKLRSGAPAPTSLTSPPALIQNQLEGQTSGIETWGSYQATRDWRLSAGWVVLSENLHLVPGSNDPVGPSALGNDPVHTWMLRSSLNLTGTQDFDFTIRHVSALPLPAVPAYTAVDARIAWRVNRSTELSITAQNLFDPTHVEFNAPATASQIDRGVFFKILWRS